jgi:thiol:disulfide interchange protein
MKKILSLISAFFSRLFKGGSSEGKNDGTATAVDFYSASGTKKVLGQVIGEAFGQNRKPVLCFHADWCGASVKFKASLSDPRMREALNDAALIIIDSDMDMDQDKLSEKYHIRHVPTFIRINRDGSVIKAITGAEWGEDTTENMAPVMKRFLE